MNLIEVPIYIEEDDNPELRDLGIEPDVKSFISNSYINPNNIVFIYDYKD